MTLVKLENNELTLIDLLKRVTRFLKNKSRQIIELTMVKFAKKKNVK